MKSQRLLYLCAHQMAAYHWQAGTLACEETFSPSEAGVEQFARYLARHPQSIFALLANVGEEGFHIENIPYLRGTDRKTVVQRKLGQAFYNTPLTTAISLGHEKSRRKDERILLAGLTNPAFFQPWLDAIRTSQVALSGVYSLPLLAPLLLKKLRLPAEPCLLLTVQDQSLRQSYFEKGELHFSRLSPLQQSSIGGIAQAFATESLKLQQYLASQRLIGRSQTITAHILAHPGAFKAIQNSCVDTQTVRFNILDITACAQSTGLKTIPPDTHSDLLFLHLLETNPPAAQFAGEDLRHEFQVGQVRSLLQGAGALVLIGCLLLSGKSLFDAHELAQEAETLRNEATLAHQRYDAIVKTFPRIPTDTETLKNVIDRYLVQERRSVTPTAFFREISRVMDAEPAVELESIDWILGGTESASGDAAVKQSDVRPTPEGSESLIVHASLHMPGGAEPRQTLAVLERFVSDLKSASSLQVEILQQPFDIEPGKSLRSGDTAQRDDKPRGFRLQIIRKIPS